MIKIFLQIGDILFNGNIVYGIVKLFNLENDEILYNLLVSDNYFIINDELMGDYNSVILRILENKK